MTIGTNVAGKMVTALKRLGFDKVFDTNTGADFTIMEEANEFVERFQKIRKNQMQILKMSMHLIFMYKFTKNL